MTSSKKLRLLSIVGTRPELIRLSLCLPAFDAHFNHRVFNTRQNADIHLNDSFYSELKLRSPDYSVNNTSVTLESFISASLCKLEEILSDFTPDACCILGDTNSGILSFFLKRRGIPVFHLEAGNRSFDSNVPEEVNRRLIDHFADYNLVYTEAARANLINEGISSRYIFKIGSPLREVFDHFSVSINSSDILSKLQLETDKYILASIHRAENVDNILHLTQLLSSLEYCSKLLNRCIVLSLHPRTRKRLVEQKLTLPNCFHALPPFGFFDYCHLQSKAHVVVSDSGSISEESALLGFPAVTLRLSMERPEALESGSILLSDFTGTNLLNAINLATNAPTIDRIPLDYNIKNTSSRVVGLIQSLAPLHSYWYGLQSPAKLAHDA